MARLKKNFAAASMTLSEPAPNEYEFGWVFLITTAGGDDGANIPSMVIVNKFSEQVVASSADYDLAEFVRRYQELIGANRTHHQVYQGPMRVPWPWRRQPVKSVAERAKEAGFYELRGREDAR